MPEPPFLRGVRITHPDRMMFARAIAESLVEHDPGLFTTRFSKLGRERRILVDYLRNNRTNTSVAAFSTRGREGSPVSLPLSWTELTPSLDPLSFTIDTLSARLRRQRKNPWERYYGVNSGYRVDAMR